MYKPGVKETLLTKRVNKEFKKEKVYFKIKNFKKMW